MNTPGRQQKIDRLILAGVIIGPIVLAVCAYLRLPGVFHPSIAFHWTLMTATAWISLVVVEALAIWTAWRSPVLGGNAARALLIIVAVLGTVSLLEWIPHQEHWFSSMSRRLAIFALLFQRPVPFVVCTLSLVIARRALNIQLVRRENESCHRPSRISIRELMIWTLVIAAVFSLAYHITHWFQSLELAVSNQLPDWYTIYFLVAHLPSWVFLVVSLAYLHYTGRWMWLPGVIAVYTAMAVGKAYIDVAIFQTYFGASGIDPFSLTAILWTAVGAVPTLIATWLLRLFGFRFVRVTRSQPAV